MLEGFGGSADELKQVFPTIGAKLERAGFPSVSAATNQYPGELGAMAKLSKSEVSERLKKFKGWRLDADTIKKEYQFPSCPKAIRFVNQVAEISEQADHHPDILISFRKVTLSLSTHDEGGITQKDFRLAEQLEGADGKPNKEVE
jgi:4a-hydroxytetrahydrobiopterin dehydratase